MEPWIPAGSLVLVDEAVGSRELRAGDIACFQSMKGTRVMHRVLFAEDGIVLTKGDNHPREDPTWEPFQCHGRVVAMKGRGRGPWRWENAFGRWLGLRTNPLRPASIGYLLRQLLKTFCFSLSTDQPAKKLKRNFRHSQRGRPAVAGAPEFQWIGNDLVVYEPSDDAVHVLNPTAVRILRARQQGQSADEIAKSFSVEYPDVPLDDLRQDIKLTLDDFEALKLPELPTPSDP